MRWSQILTLASLFCFAGPAAAETASDFSLRNMNNKEISLSDYEGKVVLVNFWATWCGPCMVELPHLQALENELADQGFVVITISTDDAKNKSKVKPLIMSKGYTFEVLLDTETEVIARYNPEKTLPYTFVVDQKGDVALRHAGYNPGDEVTIREKVLSLLQAVPAE